MELGLLGLLRADPMVFVLLCASLVGAISLHEFAHAFVADLQGDRMPRAMGRVTLNPARHLDPLGTVCLLLAGFGWGRPVEFRPQALASRRFGPAMVALAGPVMNLLLALAGAFLYVLVENPAAGELQFGAESTLGLFLLLFFTINTWLAVFNLIPLPPLDGSRLLTVFLPPDKQRIVYFLDQYGILILLVLVFFGGTQFLAPLADFFGSLLLRVAGA